MNGRPSSGLPTFARSGALRAVLSPDLYSRRFFAALAASCLLHAAIVFLPYLGATTAVSRPSLRDGKAQGPVPILNIRMVVLEVGPVARAEGASTAVPPVRRDAGEESRPQAERALGAGVLPVPAPTYYTSDQLTKRPRPTTEPRLDVPELGPIFPFGKVVLRIWISELGNVVAVEVEKSDLPEAVSATAAAAFERLRFIPGEIDGRRVGSVMRVEVSYDDGTQLPR